MQFELHANQDHRTRRSFLRGRSWLEIILLVSFILCLLIGIAAFGAFWVLYQDTEPKMPDHGLETLYVPGIIPQLALMQLAGDPPNALAHQAFNAGEMDTAYALALFDVGTNGSNLAGLWLRLAHFAEEKELRIQALTAYRRVYALAIFDSTLSPVERGQLLAQASQGLLDLGQGQEARDITDQAKRLGEQYPGLLPSQRSQIFNILLPLGQALDDAFLKNQLDELTRNPYLAPQGLLVTDGLSPFGLTLLETMLPIAHSQMLSDSIASGELGTAVSVRQMATRRLVEQLNIAVIQGVDNAQFIETERVALAQALLQENGRRDEYFQRQMGQNPPLEEQVRLLHAQRAWLILKIQSALKGFGQIIVPSWGESIAAGITADDGSVTSIQDSIYLRELRQLTEQLDTTWGLLIESHMGNQLSSLDRTLLRIQILRWLALQIELGLYPTDQAQNIHSRLDAAQDEAARLGHPVALPILYESQALPPGFRIQSIE